MSRLWNAGQTKGEPSDVESEHEALRRQRLEAARELETLKQALAERVAGVQARERELEQALALVAKSEGKQGTSLPKPRLEEVRVRLAEAREARAARAGDLDGREAALAERERTVAMRVREIEAPTAAAPEAAPPQHAEAAKELAERAAAVNERDAVLEARAAELEAREAAVAAREEELAAAPPPEPEPDPEPPTAKELARLTAKLAELREAEKAFARTQAELSARSDALTEREAALGLRERAVAAKEAPPSPELDELEARIRRLEHRSTRAGTGTTQTFSSGLRALEHRGLRRSDAPNEPLH